MSLRMAGQAAAPGIEGGVGQAHWFSNDIEEECEQRLKRVRIVIADTESAASTKYARLERMLNTWEFCDVFRCKTMFSSSLPVLETGVDAATGAGADAMSVAEVMAEVARGCEKLANGGDLARTTAEPSAGSSPSASQLTEEQFETIAANRRAALEKRRLKQVLSLRTCDLACSQACCLPCAPLQCRRGKEC